MRLVHLSDLHLEPAPEALFPGVEAVLDKAAAAVRALRPDLVVVTGDLTSFGGLRQSDLAQVKHWLDALDLPYVAIAGNHDLGASPERAARHPETEAYEPVPWAKTHFGQVFGKAPVVALDLGAVALVAFSLRAGDPDGTLPALRAALGRYAKPVILAGHYPLSPVRTAGPCGASSADATGSFLPELVKPLWPLVEAFPQVRLYLAGHVHVNSAKVFHCRCLQLTTGGLGPGASSLRILTATAQGIRYDTLIGPGPLGFWERLAPEMGPYDPAYHLGAPEERSGEWPW
ncbi:MAG: metallophosphoesterase [Firmicutes bacterium]|nr:metallophosphoesterase [Alicyclobacillaceae bacterium]MCL6496306.1 metallophosphoesterase [Bacillota bacterium]